MILLIIMIYFFIFEIFKERSGRFLPYVSVVEDRIDQKASLQTSSDTPSEPSFSLINSILGVLTGFVTGNYVLLNITKNHFIINLLYV